MEGVPLLPPPPIAAASDHITGPWGPNGGDEEGRRGWRRPGSRAAALLGSTPPRGHPSPRSAASPLGGRRCCGGGWVGVGDRGGGVCGVSRSGGVAGQRGI
ncbi:hypothetical protein SETIT_4G197500v2 [Setaria italica]|uniref:Uncharacterized protein n=2 Tax=Setaria TaxID=4554 RepID=A0A368QW71_SETIT|nr:hypothetical protein SETIT_4G197500v2 [Setaria italica]TKW22103.1 hypothetical protein SEVIR_4G207001v2 [Setaria viridis]